MTQRLLFLFLIIPIFSFGPPKLNEKFINDAFNENNYLVFNPDSTFKYRLSYHLFHDISCGHYKVVKDTIFLFYESDLRDTFCNKEIDTTNFDSASLAFRPTKLFYKDDKLYKIENGQVQTSSRIQLDFKPPKAWGYWKKYFLFGPYIKKNNDTYYMIISSKVKWQSTKTKTSR